MFLLHFVCCCNGYAVLLQVANSLVLYQMRILEEEDIFFKLQSSDDRYA